MASTILKRTASQVSGLVLLVALMASGCCGPMSCGTRGCGGNSSGPLMVGGPSCGGGCDGCGETYVDEWINHPPSCDNCDSCGNHNGQSCGSCRPMFDGIKSLWGYRRDCGCESTCGADQACGSSGGCDTCSGGGCSSCGGGQHYAGGHVSHSYVDSSGGIPMPHQTSGSPTIVETKPAIKAYQPTRTKQIFRPKGSVAGSNSRGSY